jgi:cystathionine gamma-synthase
LPTWEDVVGYEEGDKRVSDALKIGYPRFKIHNSVERLMEFVLSRYDGAFPTVSHRSDEDPPSSSPSSSSSTLPPSMSSDSDRLECLIWPTQPVAEAFQRFLNVDSGFAAIQSILVPVQFEGLHCVLYPSVLKQHAKKFWQHTGEIVSSRLAEAALQSLGAGQPADWSVTDSHSMCGKRQSASDVHMLERDDDYSATTQTLRERIAAIVGEAPSQVTLCVSGMASIYAALKCVLALVDAAVAAQAGDDDDEAARHRRREGLGKVVVFGFPYLDTLKMMQTKGLCPLGCEFYGNGDERDLDALEALLRSHSQTHGAADGAGAVFAPTGGVSAVFTEFPSNPLLKCPHLQRLSALAQEFGFLLVVDDTVGNFANTDLLHTQGLRVDLLCTSLTKMFSGRGDALAGSLIVNSYCHCHSSSDGGSSESSSNSSGNSNSSSSGSNSSTSLERARLRARFLTEEVLSHCHSHGHSSSSRSSSNHNGGSGGSAHRIHVPPLFEADAATLEVNSRSFLQRSHRINQTAAALADWLSRHPAVAQLYYPNKSDAYDQVMRPSCHAPHPTPATATAASSIVPVASVVHEPGYSSLMSIVLQPGVDETAFFDALEVCKGPSLGTNFTLACPYTLLAHYAELDWAAAYGVDRRLVRVSVGLEDFQDLQDRFERALRCACHADLWHALRAALVQSRTAVAAQTQAPPLANANTSSKDNGKGKGKGKGKRVLLPVQVGDQVVSRVLSFLVPGAGLPVVSERSHL